MIAFICNILLAVPVPYSDLPDDASCYTCGTWIAVFAIVALLWWILFIIALIKPKLFK